jgi:hypothetical protein
MVDRIVAAARRGARVRVIVSATSNSNQAAAALKHRYGELLAAGAELHEIPGIEPGIARAAPGVPPAGGRARL